MDHKARVIVACVLLACLVLTLACGARPATRPAASVRPAGRAAETADASHKLAYRPVVIPACLTAEQCARLVAHASQKLQRSMVVGDVVTNARTSEQAWVSFDDAGAGDIAREIRARLSALCGVFRAELFEHVQVVRYTQSQEYRPHFDACVARCDEMRRERIPRRATLLVYLTDGFDDGATHFPAIGARYKPRVGDGLLFYNVDADTGNELAESLHAGEPVSRGVKFVANCWVRFDHAAARV